MHRNRSVDVHKFAMVPRADIPRSGFKIETSHKTTFDSGYLVPIYVDEVLPGDTFNLKMTAFGRLATPIVPVMDNLYLETFFFFVPNRLVWTNWHKFCGEQENPGDSTSFEIPYVQSPLGGFAQGSLFDYLGIPTAGQTASNAWIRVNSLPLRAYNLIWNEWFRDENLQTRAYKYLGDGPDDVANFTIKRRGKRHDYFTSCLPWVQKGVSVPLPLGTNAPVFTQTSEVPGANQARPAMKVRKTDGTLVTSGILTGITSGSDFAGSSAGTMTAASGYFPTNLFTDLSQATAATINQIRQAFQIQKLLERDARGGTRYTELIRSHFGVVSPDARLQRPEYLGGGSSYVNINPVAQTSGTASTAGYTPTPQGNLAAFGTVTAHGHGFTQSFTEHGYVIGLASVRADLNYQQGLRKLWSRKTRYDFYWPVFAMLGEQAVLNKEIYSDGSAADDDVFGYQERWAEYRYHPSYTTSMMRSTHLTPLDVWHLAQKFESLPTLNESFIQENPPVERVVATTEVTGQQFLLDCFFHIRAARPLPMYSVPGLVDHF